MGTPPDILKRSQKSWVLLAQTAAWIVGVLAGFLLPPPVGTVAESRVYVRFAQFVITLVIGFVLLAAMRWKSPKHTFRWAAVSAIFLILGSVMFFGYQLLAARWTAEYNSQRVVIGAVFTSFGQDYHQQNPNLLPSELIMNVAGATEKIWTQESLTQRRLLLAAMYVLAMPLFTIAIMSLLQAIQCAGAKTAARKRTR